MTDGPSNQHQKPDSHMLSKVYVQHLSNNINEMIMKWAKAAASSMRVSSPMTSPSPSVDVSKMLLQQASELGPYTVPY
ncbi:hypothetical protein SeMB42_g01304 [Synchytrium endobioticum]|uniref:Uncharacterized protein n=1 Tax=Synchytrium endobioticum TaxID=286115 RepID=A0A507DM52_9FUNG|nr:hypothetical protein SeMB42_g01304 [Synchytrium endobioticum]